MRVMMAIMSPFMGKKMRKRIVTIKNKESPQSIFEEAIGKEYIPVGLTNLTGTIEKDLQDDLLEKLTWALRILHVQSTQYRFRIVAPYYFGWIIC